MNFGDDDDVANVRILLASAAPRFRSSIKRLAKDRRDPLEDFSDGEIANAMFHSIKKSVESMLGG